MLLASPGLWMVVFPIRPGDANEQMKATKCMKCNEMCNEMCMKCAKSYEEQ